MFQLLKIPFKEWGSEQALNSYVFLICAQLQYNIVTLRKLGQNAELTFE